MKQGHGVGPPGAGHEHGLAGADELLVEDGSPEFAIGGVEAAFGGHGGRILPQNANALIRQ